ncbi:hypothetical protein BH10ACT8_BH10ACT8_15130 [soil metagenome]|jgi:hypothetical protein
MATSGSPRIRALLLGGIALAGLCISGCTPSHHAPAPRTTGAVAIGGAPGRTTIATPDPVSTAPSVAGGVALAHIPCKVTPPVAWKAALTRGVLWRGLTDTEATGAPTPDGSGVLHQTNVGGTAEIALVGTNQRVLQPVATLPRSDGAQFSYTAVTSHYVAFIYALTNGQAAQSRWDLYLFNRSTGRLSLITHNPRTAAGAALPSDWVRPILTDRYLYWLQGAQTGLPWGGSELQQYDLGTGRIRTLYRGLVSAMVVVGPTVLYTAVPAHADLKLSDPPMAMAAVAADTGEAVRAPAGITAAADGAFTIVESEGTLVWNTSAGTLRAWRAEWGKSITIVPTADGWPLALKLGMSGPAYPRIYHQFVVWEPGDTWVLDLKTNSFVILSENGGGEELSGSLLAIEHYSSAVKPTFGGTHVFDQAVLDLASMPDLPACK